MHCLTNMKTHKQMIGRQIDDRQIDRQICLCVFICVCVSVVTKKALDQATNKNIIKKRQKETSNLMIQPTSYNTVFLQHFLFYSNCPFMFSSILFFPFGEEQVSIPGIVCHWALSPTLTFLYSSQYHKGQKLANCIPKTLLQNGSQLDLACRNTCNRLEAGRRET